MSSEDMPWTYRVSRKKSAGMLAIASVFVAIGVAVVLDGSASGWVAIALFGLGIPLGLWQLIVPGSVRIDETSVEVRHFWWVRRYLLEECGEFRPWSVRRHELVVFDYHGTRDGPWRRWGRRQFGYTDSLPDTYGFGARALSDLLNSVRELTLHLK